MRFLTLDLLLTSPIVNVVVVLGSERLYSDMLRRFNSQKTGAGETIPVVKVDKSGGCVDRDEAYLQQYRQSQIREYFFGDANTTLSPHTQQIDFNQVIIYKLAEREWQHLRLYHLLWLISFSN